MKIYVIERREFTYKDGRNIFSGVLLQNGFSTLEGAQSFIESCSGLPYKCDDYHYKTCGFDEYFIHEILVKE